MTLAGFDNLLDQCLGVRAGEQVVLLTDDGTDTEVIERLADGIGRRRAVPIVTRIPLPSLPGSEPPTAVAALMVQASAIVELTSLFIRSSPARRTGTEMGVSHLAIPGMRFGTFRDWRPLP